MGEGEKADTTILPEPWGSTETTSMGLYDRLLDMVPAWDPEAESGLARWRGDFAATIPPPGH